MDNEERQGRRGRAGKGEENRVDFLDLVPVCCLAEGAKWQQEQHRTTEV